MTACLDLRKRPGSQEGRVPRDLTLHSSHAFHGGGQRLCNSKAITIVEFQDIFCKQIILNLCKSDILVITIAEFQAGIISSYHFELQ